MSHRNKKSVPADRKSVRARAILYRTVFLGLSALCVYMGLRHSPAPQLFRHFDLLLHFGIFFSLAFVSLFAFPNRMGFLLLPLLIAAGFGIEVFQDLFMSGRNGSWNDFFANTLGVFVGAAIGVFIRPRRE